jgi:hypothetical protein
MAEEGAAGVDRAALAHRRSWPAPCSPSGTQPPLTAAVRRDACWQGDGPYPPNWPWRRASGLIVAVKRSRLFFRLRAWLRAKSTDTLSLIWRSPGMDHQSC